MGAWRVFVRGGNLYRTYKYNRLYWTWRKWNEHKNSDTAECEIEDDCARMKLRLNYGQYSETLLN